MTAGERPVARAGDPFAAADAHASGDAACDRLLLERALRTLADARDGLERSGRVGMAARVGRALEALEEVHGEVESEVFEALDEAPPVMATEGEGGARR